MTGSNTFSGISVAKLGGDATIVLEENVVTSGTPLSGKYKVKCVYADGSFSESKSMSYDTDRFNIWRGITEHCDYMKDSIRVWDKPGFSSPSVGKAFYIDFNGYNENPGQFEIISDLDDPLIGGIGVDITFTHETVQEYGKNLFFQPIPFEMLRTYETKP